MEPQQLKLRRKALGYTQEDFALVLAVSRSTVIRWESGVQPMPGMLELALCALEGREDLARRYVSNRCLFEGLRA